MLSLNVCKNSVISLYFRNDEGNRQLESSFTSMLHFCLVCALAPIFFIYCGRCVEMDNERDTKNETVILMDY